MRQMDQMSAQPHSCEADFYTKMQSMEVLAQSPTGSWEGKQSGEVWDVT